MRHTHLVAVLLLVAGVAHAEPRASRRSVSANGEYRVGMTVEAPGRCRLEVVGSAGVKWSLSRCVGGADDAYFVSRDGERVWVVRTLPGSSGKPRRERQGRHWVEVPGFAEVVVAEKLDRRGVRRDSRRLSQLVSRRGLEKVRRTAHHFLWLEGVNGVPGKGPRMGAAGQVELETVEGNTVVLPLE